MSDTPKLIFPDIKAQIKSIDGQKHIWDALRRKYLVLTPEEWVRQHVIAWLINERSIPAQSISQEHPVDINGQNQRADIVVIDKFAQPYILVECKATDVDIDNEVAMQAWRYNSVLRARYVLLTNGRSLWCYEYHNGQYRPIRF